MLPCQDIVPVQCLNDCVYSARADELPDESLGCPLSGKRHKYEYDTEYS